MKTGVLWPDSGGSGPVWVWEEHFDPPVIPLLRHTWGEHLHRRAGHLNCLSTESPQDHRSRPPGHRAF